MRGLRGAAARSGLILACLLASGCGKWKAAPTRGDVARAMAASAAAPAPSRDKDLDGLPDDVELQFAATLGTDPERADSDGDGLNDAFEVFGSGWLYMASGGVAGALEVGAPAGRADDPARAHGADELVDTDGDGVPDVLEYAGYRYDWQAAGFVLDAAGARTDPLQWSTDQDAYSDGMEVSGVNMDVAVKAPGNDPLVPAYPDIVVELVSYTVTANDTISEGTGGQIEKGQTWNREVRTEHATTKEMGYEVSAKLSLGGDGVGFELGGTFKQSWGSTDTQSVAASTGGSLSEQVNWNRVRTFNPVDAAHLELAVRVTNRGTAPASHVVPTLGVRIGGANVATFAPAGLEISTLPAGATYPSQAGAALVIDRDGSGNPISLTDTELRAVEAGAPITLVVTQKKADVMRFSSSGAWESVGDAGEYMARIAAVSADLLADVGPLPGGDQARLLHALVYAGGAPPRPQVTVRDAMARAFGFAGTGATGYHVEYPEPDGRVTVVPFGAAASDGVWRWGIDTVTLEQARRAGPIATADAMLGVPLRAGASVTLRAPRPARELLPVIHLAYAVPTDQGHEVVVCASDYDGIADVAFLDQAGGSHPLSADPRGPWFYSTVLKDYAFAGAGIEKVRVTSVRPGGEGEVAVPRVREAVVNVIYTPVARPPIVRAPTYDTETHRFHVRVEPGGSLEADQILWVRLLHPKLGSGSTAGLVALAAPPNFFEDPYGWEVYLDHGWLTGMRLVAYSKAGQYTAVTVSGSRNLAPHGAGSVEMLSEYFWFPFTDNVWEVEVEDLDRGDGDNWWQLGSNDWPGNGTEWLVSLWKARNGVDLLPDVYLRPTDTSALVFTQRAKRIYPNAMGGLSPSSYFAGLTYEEIGQLWDGFEKGYLETGVVGTDPAFSFGVDSVILFETSDHRLGKLYVWYFWDPRHWYTSDRLQSVKFSYVVYKKDADILPVTSLDYLNASVDWSVGQAVKPIFPSSTVGGVPELYEACRWEAGISWTTPRTCWPAPGVLPAGLEFSEATGAVFGTPTASGNAHLAVFASNTGNKPGVSNAPMEELRIRVLDQATLEYDRDSYRCPTGQATEAATCLIPAPVASGALTAFRITPGLPAGLTLATPATTTDAARWGAISGTPTEQTALTTYTVTADNAAGDRATTTFKLETPLSAPRALTYPATSYTFKVDQALPLLGTAGAIRPTYQGGAIETFSPAELVPGVQVDPATGLLVGTPTTAAAAAAFTITGTNAAGSTTVKLTITVSP